MFVGLGAMLLLALSLVALGLLLFGPKENIYLALIKKYFIEIGFLISLSAVLVSTFYSEVLHYAPCFHCWVQRIFMFPQVLLYGVAWFRRDRNVLWYSLPLLVVGIADSLFLNYKYYINPNSAPCDASGVSCVQNLVSEFGGVVSIPSLALMGFVSFIILLLVVNFYKNDKSGN